MSSAAQRTDLLHRMLLVRHFAEHDAAVPLGGHALAFRVGEEAVAAGTWAALGPADAVLRADPDAHCGPAGVTIRLIDDRDPRDAAGRLTAARHEGAPVLLCRICAAPGDPTAETVDGLDVEAVLSAAQAHLIALRAGRGADLIELCTGVPADHPDPIAVLTARMYADHQLDDNALHAIDRDAVTRVTAVLAHH